MNGATTWEIAFNVSTVGTWLKRCFRKKKKSWVWLFSLTYQHCRDKVTIKVLNKVVRQKHQVFRPRKMYFNPPTPNVLMMAKKLMLNHGLRNQKVNKMRARQRLAKKEFSDFFLRKAFSKLWTSGEVKNCLSLCCDLNLRVH